MRSAHLIAVAAIVLLSACSKSPQADKKDDADAATPGVSLSADETKNLGIATAPAQAASWRREIVGFGVVTALDSVAQSDADVLTASAAAAQSEAAAARARSLGTGEEAAVSREVVEMAQSKAAADAAALGLARRKADAVFGMHAPWQGAGERATIMARLASGKTVLVRITFPLGSIGNATPGSLKLTRLGVDAQSWTAAKIWDAPADPALPGRGFYALVDNSDLAQNEHVTAALPVGPAETGVVVPASALVFGDSETWVYVEDKPHHFLRAGVDTGKPVGEGYFLKAGGGIAAGQNIVTSGAGLLMAHEINPSSAAED